MKEKIDDSYMEMIDKNKAFEATYLKSLENKLAATLKPLKPTMSLEKSFKETEKTFRNQSVL